MRRRLASPLALLALPLALVLLNVASCSTSEDDPGTGNAGTSGGAGTTGSAGTTAAAGTTGSAGTTAAAGTTGSAGTGAAGTSVNGNAGTTGGTGAAGTNGAAGTTGTAGTGAAGTGGATLSYATHVAPIIANKCKDCHTKNASGGYNWTYANLVTNSTVTNAATVNCSFMNGSKKRVVPGSPDTSLLWIKISKTNAELKTATAKCDDAMPEGGAVLTATEKTTIHDWIMQGANP
jgi:hypothetical protein